MAIMGDVFSQLYPFVFVIGLAGYGPQLYKMWKNPACADSLSLSTWLIWTSTWLISLGYGATKLQDVMFCLTAGMNLAAHCAIVGFICHRRLINYINQNKLPHFLQPIYLRVRK
jgi:hypothetical protein